MSPHRRHQSDPRICARTGYYVQQGSAALRFELRRILGASGKLSPRMMEIIRGLVEDWRYLGEWIKALSSKIRAIAKLNADCKRLMTVPGVGPKSRPR
jgi:transposase